MKAANRMTSTINHDVKQELEKIHYDNGYLMLQRLKQVLEPERDAQFMRLTKKYYSLQADGFSNMNEFLLHVKLLKERIAATKVELIRDKRTILCMMMALPETYQHLAQM